MSLNFGHHQDEKVGQFDGGIMGKDINMNDHNITNLPNPCGKKHAVRKQYVDELLDDKLDLGGGTMTGEIDMGINKITGHSNLSGFTDAVNLAFLTRRLNDKLHRDGSIAMTDNLDMNDNKITDLDTPTDDADAATKKYVDDKIAALPNPTHYYHFEFASVGKDYWRQAYQLTGFIFWTNNRDIKLTILAHVFDTDNNIAHLDIHYKVIYWTKAKVKRHKKSMQIMSMSTTQLPGVIYKRLGYSNLILSKTFPVSLWNTDTVKPVEVSATKVCAIS